MLQIISGYRRGQSCLDWLDARHSFSFGHYHDPARMGFSDLRVLNEDCIQPGQGFARHPHQDMEILTWVLEGQLEHRDSLGNRCRIQPGEPQLMSAGRGIQHSEYNASPEQPLHLLQIWIRPARQGLAPGYQQQAFPPEGRRGRLQLLASPDDTDGTLFIHQDVRIHAGAFHGSEQQQLSLAEARYTYIQVTRSALTINGQRLAAGDAASLHNGRELTLGQGEQAEILLFDLRPADPMVY